MSFSKSKEHKHRGFTLIELLVVISIISLLSTIVLSTLNNARAKSRDARRLHDLTQIRTALELYAQDHDGQYPVNKASDNSYYGGWVGSSTCFGGYNNPEGINGIIMASGLVSEGYISKIPEDPKPLDEGRCYIYYSDEFGVDYKLWVNGTVEAFDPWATNHPLKNPKSDLSQAVKSTSLSIQTPAFEQL